MLVLCSEALQPLSLVRVYPIGVITMLDNGAADEKIIAIPFSDPYYNVYSAISELPAHVFQEMQHFFSVYKQLEHKTTAVNEVAGREQAVAAVAKALKNYEIKFGRGGTMPLRG